VPDIPDAPDVPRAATNAPEGGASAWQPGDPTPAASASSSPQPDWNPPQQASGYGTGQQPVYGTPPPAYGTPVAPPPGYGTQPYPYGGGTQTAQPILSIISMIAGIVGVIGFPVVGFIPFVGGILGLLIPAAAIVLAILGRSKEPKGRPFWLTGLITGIVGIVLAIGSIIVWAAIFASIDYTTG
jgi:hypothetical protein